ncbi:radical SAM protein [Hyphococcus sp.]|uniref:radical SAM protein n=1 Tax=Hyphococcus sp. TaxID=2038636 RepID=UPI0035C70DC4
MDGEQHTLKKFQHPDITAEGETRAAAPFVKLDTLWVNTGTLCNVECTHCYIESSPSNDRLVYLTAADLTPLLEEARSMGAAEIGFTGGEPFMNPDMIPMTEAALSRGFETLILTNAMRPMMRPRICEGLTDLRKKFGDRLGLRISLDHYSVEGHDAERGRGAFDAGMAGVKWLHDNGFAITIAGRSLTGESEQDLRTGFARLFATSSLTLDAHDPAQLVIFPEMDPVRDVPEITNACWSILGKNPADVMCASSRMLVKRKGADKPVVLSCTLLPYDARFELGESLAKASTPVKLNHPFCAQFCVLGGASCSG